MDPKKGRKRPIENEDNVQMSGESAPKKPLKDASPTLSLFQSFQMELDSRHDKYERIVKCSRDITIQSKRVIFLLHRGIDEKSRAKTLEEAAGKLVCIKELFKKIATELINEDCYQFIRAYSPGLQEFIEAYSFWYFLKHDSLIRVEQIRKELVFENALENTNTEEVQQPKVDHHPAKDKPVPNSTANKKVFIPPAEYILGISDLTGELMRLAINSVGQGNFKSPLKICKMLQKIHSEFIMFGNRLRGLPKKLEVLKNSLKKVESTCYTIHIRGSEVPKNMLATLIASSGDSTIDGH